MYRFQGDFKDTDNSPLKGRRARQRPGRAYVVDRRQTTLTEKVVSRGPPLRPGRDGGAVTQYTGERSEVTGKEGWGGGGGRERGGEPYTLLTLNLLRNPC